MTGHASLLQISGMVTGYMKTGIALLRMLGDLIGQVLKLELYRISSHIVVGVAVIPEAISWHNLRLGKT